jgi:hypothetical protein
LPTVNGPHPCSLLISFCLLFFAYYPLPIAYCPLLIDLCITPPSSLPPPWSHLQY